MTVLTKRRAALRTWRVGTAVALLVALVGLSACGGSDSDADSDPQSGAGAAPATPDSRENRALTRLNECLAEQGVEVPDADHSGSGPPPQPENQQQFQEALEGPCREFQEDAFGGAGEQEQTQLQDQLTAFTSCMRENGVDIPDFEHGAGPPPAVTQLDQDDPAVRKALKACEDKVPQFGPGAAGP